MSSRQVTIGSIADLAGVSQTTVSRVLNNHPNIRAAVRSRVQAVIQEQGYVPRAAAQALASQRSNMIAFLIPRSTAFLFSDPFFAVAVQGVAEVCARRGYLLTLSLVANRTDMESLERTLRGRHFDGVILQAASIDDPALSLMQKTRVPYVQIGRHPSIDTVSWATVDNQAGAYSAVAHLLRLGHRRIATITGPEREAAASDRRAGYVQALLEADLPIEPALIAHGDWSHESGFESLAALMQLSRPPTAVFGASDRMAIGALRAAHTLGVRVPDDLALCGFDDIPGSAFTTPPLTTVHQPIRELGAAAADLLFAQLDGAQAGHPQLSLPTTLVVRNSCGAGR